MALPRFRHRAVQTLENLMPGGHQGDPRHGSLQNQPGQGANTVENAVAHRVFGRGVTPPRGDHFRQGQDGLQVEFRIIFASFNRTMPPCRSGRRLPQWPSGGQASSGSRRRSFPPTPLEKRDHGQQHAGEQEQREGIKVGDGEVELLDLVVQGDARHPRFPGNTAAQHEDHAELPHGVRETERRTDDQPAPRQRQARTCARASRRSRRRLRAMARTPRATPPGWAARRKADCRARNR